MKKEKTSENKTQNIKVDPSLNKYDNLILFPEKVAKAREAYERLGIPDLDKINRKKKEEA